MATKEQPLIGDKIGVIMADSGALGANGMTGVVTNKPQTNGLVFDGSIGVDMGGGEVWGIGKLDDVTIEFIQRVEGDRIQAAVVDRSLEEKAVQAIRDYINGDYDLPRYTDENSFIRLADLAKGVDKEYLDEN